MTLEQALECSSKESLSFLFKLSIGKTFIFFEIWTNDYLAHRIQKPIKKLQNTAYIH